MSRSVTLRARAQALVTAQPTPALVESLRVLDAAIDVDRAAGNLDDLPAMNMTRHWLITELERRHPEAGAAVDAAFAAADLSPTWVDVDYVAVLTAAIRL
jgi:hypothetical protein